MIPINKRESIFLKPNVFFPPNSSNQPFGFPLICLPPQIKPYREWQKSKKSLVVLAVGGRGMATDRQPQMHIESNLFCNYLLVFPNQRITARKYKLMNKGINTHMNKKDAFMTPVTPKLLNHSWLLRPWLWSPRVSQEGEGIYFLSLVVHFSQCAYLTSFNPTSNTERCR